MRMEKVQFEKETEQNQSPNNEKRKEMKEKKKVGKISIND